MNRHGAVGTRIMWEGQRASPTAIITFDRSHWKEDGHGPREYVGGTPSVSGIGFPIGKPADGYLNTIRFHPCGGSEACQTAPLPWANLVWDIMKEVPDKRFHFHLRSMANPDP